MNNKKIPLILFAIVALAQLYAPAKMISAREEILDKGTEFRFLTAPVDPSDPFRGKYITLNYADNYMIMRKDSLWKTNEEIYVTFKDSVGFAKIRAVSRKKPEDGIYLKTKVDYYMNYMKPAKLVVNYPFNRFYMEESKAPKAEKLYAKHARDTAKVTYAVVRIKDGEAVLKDVIMDDMPIKEYVKNHPNEK